MAINTAYLKNTQTNLGSGGIIYDLSGAVGTTALLPSGNVNSTTPTEILAFQLSVGYSIIGTSFPVGVNINALTANGATIRWRVQRVNSANVVQASSAYSANYTTTGNQVETMTLSTTWASGDILRLSIELSRSGMGNSNVTLSVNDLNSYVQYTYRRIFAVS